MKLGGYLRVDNLQSRLESQLVLSQFGGYSGVRYCGAVGDLSRGFISTRSSRARRRLPRPRRSRPPCTNSRIRMRFRCSFGPSVTSGRD
jgi:hypothetical protein